MKTMKPAIAIALGVVLSGCVHSADYAGRYGPGPGPGPGWGMGPGMMGGYGPGMMGGYGPGMMGGYGPGMMGWGGMGGMAGFWGLERLELSAAQREAIARIEGELRDRQLALMRGMHAQEGPPGGMMFDPSGERRSYEAMAAIHKQMFEARLDARQRVWELLTPAQREQLGQAWRGR